MAPVPFALKCHGLHSPRAVPSTITAPPPAIIWSAAPTYGLVSVLCRLPYTEPSDHEALAAVSAIGPRRSACRISAGLAPTSSAVPMNPVAQREHDAKQQHARRQEPDAREQERREHSHPDADREVSRPPEHAHHQIRDQRLAAQPGHQSGSTGMNPGFSNTVPSTIVVRVLIWVLDEPRRCFSTPCRLSRSGAATLRM